MHSFVCVTWLLYIPIHTCDMTHSYVWHDPCVTCMAHSRLWHDSFICVTWPIYMFDMTHAYIWHKSFICVTFLLHNSDMTHSYIWHDSFNNAWHDSFWTCLQDFNCSSDSFICVIWLIHTCDITPWHVWHESFINVTWLLHMNGVTHAQYAWGVSMAYKIRFT